MSCIMQAIEHIDLQSYCQMFNYCYACYLVDVQDPEVLCNGLCYHCHGSRWDKIKHAFSLAMLSHTLSELTQESKWYDLYELEYKTRLGSN